ncbi:MAG: serine/threonine-protein kinase [Planctomycetota bacterium]
MTDQKNCATCGRAVPADAPLGACPACALAAALSSAPPGGDAPTPEEVAAKLPQYEFLGVLGRGGMGVVHRARHRTLDRVVALKILQPSSAPGFEERFVREAKAMARLTHPNIVTVFDFGVSDGLFWLAMEFVDGINIREALRAGRIRPPEALAIVPQICDALQYAHDRGVVHRDIKPENVLVDRDGRVKVADFGLAKLAERSPGDVSLTGASQVMGTLHYMAPEQWERPKDVDHRADIYSLGVVFYEMLTGELPVGRFEAPSKRAPVDMRLDEVVLHALERERDRRFQNAADVKTAVDAATGMAPTTPPPPPMTTSTPPIAAAEVDLGKERNIGEVALWGLAALVFLVIALATGETDLWWAFGGCLFLSGVCAIMLHEQNSERAAASGAQPPDEHR